jgi:hypothetical protein
MAVGLVAAQASAATVRFNTTTMLWGRPEWRGGEAVNTLPLMVWMNLSAHEAHLAPAEQLRFQLAAWGRAVSSASTGEAAADVDLAYLQGHFLQRRLKVTLGRQVVAGGAARFTQLDGLHMEGHLGGSVGLSVYGGLQALPRFTSGRGDAVTGARLFYRPSFGSEVGASFIQVLDRGLIARRDVGVDGRWALTSRLVLNASALFSEVERRLADGELAAQWQLLPTLLLSADVRRSAPDLYLPRSSLFSVFSSEQRDQVGGSALLQATSRLGLYGEYHALRTAEGQGYDAGARVRLRVGQRSSLGAQARLLHLASNGYRQGRLFAQHALSPTLALSAELEGTRFELPVNGERQSLTATASASWSPASGWRAQLSGMAGSTPFFVSRYELLARLSYDFSHFGGASTP